MTRSVTVLACSRVPYSGRIRCVEIIDRREECQDITGLLRVGIEVSHGHCNFETAQACRHMPRCFCGLESVSAAPPETPSCQITWSQLRYLHVTVDIQSSSEKQDFINYPHNIKVQITSERLVWPHRSGPSINPPPDGG